MKLHEEQQLPRQELQEIVPVKNQQREAPTNPGLIQSKLERRQQAKNRRTKQSIVDRGKANSMRVALGIPTQEIETSEQMTPERAKTVKWYSSNTVSGEKSTPDGKKIYGLSLTTNPDYAQSYSKTKKVTLFDISAAKLKPVTFNFGMTIDAAKRDEILSGGFDGVIFEGMGGSEVALLTEVGKIEGEIIPIPKGLQSLIDSHKPISPSIVEEYAIKLPTGYILEGERYIFKNSQK